MQTFWISTLGCKVNHYESQQIAALLSAAGLVQVEHAAAADLRVVNTCAVTVQAASKSRQVMRRAAAAGSPLCSRERGCPQPHPLRVRTPALPDSGGRPHRVVVLGCLATGRAGPSVATGADAVIGHDGDVSIEVGKLLKHWQAEDRVDPTLSDTRDARPEPGGNDVWMNQAGVPALAVAENSRPQTRPAVKQNPAGDDMKAAPRRRQRALLKIQDGCDAHCSYCIIPKLRPTLWSKPPAAAVDEARRLVDAGHSEIVLTGIFLGAFGHATALRRRQEGGSHLTGLVEALCRDVRGLKRLRLSSLEPGDLTDELLEVLGACPQVVPHFHLPLQSGCDRVLRRMNRQYGRDDYLRMVERVEGAFDRPALTTDIIVGFPGEDDEAFADTLSVVDAAEFMHIHAFPFSPRPGTAAARWKEQFVNPAIANERIDLLNRRSEEKSLAFRRQFLGESAEVMVERPRRREGLLYGRCERYFTIHFAGPAELIGGAAKVRIDRVEGARTIGRIETTPAKAGATNGKQAAACTTNKGGEEAR